MSDLTLTSDIEKQLDSQINKIPGLFISEEERKKTLEKMRKAENSSREVQVKVNCEICGKLLNQKSLARHIRDLHSGRKSSVLSLVNDFDQHSKRKPDDSLSPPCSQPDPKKSASQDTSVIVNGSSDSPKLRSASGLKGSPQ